MLVLQKIMLALVFPDLYLMAEGDGVAPDLEELRDVEQDGQEDDGQDVIPEN